MSDIITALSTKTGIDEGLVRKGLGAVLTFLQKNLPGDAFGNLRAALPGASDMLSAYEPEPEGANSGFRGMVSSLAAKLCGGAGSGGAHLLADLSRLGLSADQIEKFLPQALESLKAYLPAELIEQIKSVITTLATPAGTSGG